MYLHFLRSDFKHRVDEGTVPEINWTDIRPFLRLQHFTPEIMEKRNSASAGLCAWVIGIVRYYDVVVVVEPKKKSLRIANDVFEKSESALNSLRKRLSALQSRFDGLISQQKTAQLLMDEAKNAAERGCPSIPFVSSEFHLSTFIHFLQLFY